MGRGRGGGGARRGRCRPGHRAVSTRDSVRYAIAVLLAGGTATAMGIGHPYWAMVAAVLVVVLQVVTELLVGRNYALALLFITPMALLMGQIAAPRPMGALLFDRAVETLIGAAVGLLMILVGALLRHGSRSAVTGEQGPPPQSARVALPRGGRLGREGDEFGGRRAS